ncbi:hypothetical protein AcW2_000031 [Taiwanofungus camphoratus]|nr:hypothetical protein AcW2_000031 [Antrodia cinnamomea]
MAPLSRPIAECQPRSGPAPSLAIAPGPVPGHALHTPDSIPPSTNAPSSLANASTRSLTCPLIYPASPSSFLSLTLPHSLPCPPPRPIGAHAPASDVLHCPRPCPDFCTVACPVLYPCHSPSLIVLVLPPRPIASPNAQPPASKRETDPPRPIHVKRTRTPVSHFQFAPCVRCHKQISLHRRRAPTQLSAASRSTIGPGAISATLYSQSSRARAPLLSVAAAAVGSPVALRVPHRCCARRPSSEARCPRRLPPSATIGVLRSASRVRSQRAHAQRALPTQAHTTQRRGNRAALTPLPPRPAPHRITHSAPPRPHRPLASPVPIFAQRPPSRLVSSLTPHSCQNLPAHTAPTSTPP